jgi:excisionase family DNA binding protein
VTGRVEWAQRGRAACHWSAHGRERPYLTIRETAAHLALSTRTIHRYIAAGKLKAYRVAGEKVIRIKRQDVEALLQPVGAEGQAPGAGGNQE